VMGEVSSLAGDLLHLSPVDHHHRHRHPSGAAEVLAGCVGGSSPTHGASLTCVGDRMMVLLLPHQRHPSFFSHR
jgi:hypothetical protein